jgi:hypothetical protein
MRLHVVGIVLAACVGASVGFDASADERSMLRTVEGRIAELSEAPAEGDLVAVTVRLAPEGDRAEPLDVLLAPRGVLEEIDFELAPGDRLRVRLFVAEDGPRPAHKVMNITRGTMVRLRTLHRDPLWNRQGHWEGGACRRGGPRHGPRRQGPGPGR